MKRLSSAISLLLLVLLFLVPIFSWVAAAMGLPVQNLLCAEGFRWLSLHALEHLTPPILGPVIAGVIALGSLDASGILDAYRRSHRTANERIGHIAALVTFGILLAAFLVPVFKSGSELRSITGHLYPSPWFTSIPFALSIIIFLSTLCYGLFARHEHPLRLPGTLLSRGVTRHALWLIDVSLLSLLIQIIGYIFQDAGA